MQCVGRKAVAVERGRGCLHGGVRHVWTLARETGLEEAIEREADERGERHLQRDAGAGLAVGERRISIRPYQNTPSPSRLMTRKSADQRELSGTIEKTTTGKLGNIHACEHRCDTRSAGLRHPLAAL